MKKVKLLLASLSAALIFSSTAAGETMYVTASKLNVRRFANTNSDILGTLPYGKEVDVTKAATDGWYKITYQDANAFISGSYLKAEVPNEERNYMGKWMITAYQETGYCCANGNYPSRGYTVACNSLPFGTRIYIEGIGERVVEDRGPSSMGSEWIDLYLGDTSECLAFGVQFRDVYVID